MVGTTVSHYRILEKLGGGGMGVVYKAQDMRLDRAVALKFLPPDLTRDSEAKARFIHEAKAASALQHNNICVVHDIDETENGQLFIVMEFYEGVTLKKKIEQGPLKIDEALAIAMQVAQGLLKAHEHAMVHRDIKPANIILSTDGVAKIVDFGLAKLGGMTRLTKTGATLGTTMYMSPEQTRGETVDYRTDIWSLGVVLYEMVSGQLPFKGDYEHAVLYSILNAQPDPLTSIRTGVPMELERVVDKAMAKDAAERYQHIDEMLVDLRHIVKQRELETTSSRGIGLPPGGVLSPAARSSASGPSSGPHGTSAEVGALSSGGLISGERKAPARWKLSAAAGVVVMGLVAAFAWLKPVLFERIEDSEPSPIAVVSFANQTGDQAYDYLGEAIPNLLITSLEQSRYLRVMTWERMRDVLNQMGRRDVKVIDKELGFELCRREGIQAIVVGSFVKAGETFATDAKVLDVETKELLKSTSTRGNGVQSILDDQIDDLSREIADGVGLSRKRIESVPAQIRDVTTSSMEAYNYFLRGRDDYEKWYYRQSREFLEKAVGLDTTFAMAYMWLARACGGMFDFRAQNRALEKAKALSSRAPEKERLYVDARYAGTIERDSNKQLALLEELVTKFPREKRFHYELGSLYRTRNRQEESLRECNAALALDPAFGPALNEVGYVFSAQGKYEKAIESFRRYASVSPGDANPFDSMGEIYLCMGRLNESIAMYQEALRVRPDFHSSYNNVAYVFALKEDYARALRYIDTLVNISPTPFLKAGANAWGFMYAVRQGRYRESTRRIRQAEGLLRNVLPERMTPVYYTKSWDALNRGAFAEARRELTAFSDVFARWSPKTPQTNAVLRNALFSHLELREGRLDSARARLNNAQQGVGSERDLFGGSLSLFITNIEAELLLAEHLPDSAIRVIRSAAVGSPAMGTGYRMPLYNAPFLIDMVPRAFQMKGQLDSAITEYKRLLRVDTTLKDRRLGNPLYRYRLARLCEQTGDRESAAREYARFLEIWKEADKDIPEYIDARTRLARLTKGKN